MAAFYMLTVLTNIMFSSCYTIGSSVGDMTKCSKYHFEEKVLEKLVRLEHKMELLEEKIKLDMQKFEESDIKRASNTETLQKNLEVELKSQMRLIGEKMEFEMQKFEESDRKRTTNTLALQKNMEAELKSQSRMFEDVVFNFTVRAENISKELKVQQEDAITVMATYVKFELNKIEESERHRVSMMAAIINESAHNLQTNKEVLTALTENVEENVNSTLGNIELSERDRVVIMESMRREVIQELTTQEEFRHNFSTSRTELFNELLEKQNTANSTLHEYVLSLTRNMNDNRVAVTAGASEKTYSSGSKILFPNVLTIHGINNSSVTALGTTGEFTCTRPGLYLISVFIMTNTHSTYATVYKNNNVIAYIYFSLNGYAQTNSVTVLEHLAVNDKIYIKAFGNMYVYGNQYSRMSFLQITE